tara:strand:+ start:53 stop:1069 length:1017 start_codon:yes stop_codon:yes gene_type:complete
MNYADKKGVLLVNLGTPKSPTTEDVRVYLKEFLSDRDVIRMPRILWLPLLNFVILRSRPAKSAELYKKVWTEWGSPLLYNTYLQAGLLKKKFENSENDEFFVDVAMRYGSPSIESKLLQLVKSGYRKIIILPMFPQYSTTTTRSIARKIDEIAKDNKLLNDVKIRFIKDFHDHELYIDACCDSIRDYQQKFGQPEKLLLSFHGIPESYVGADEPYRDQCLMTANLIATRLSLKKKEYEVAFQSRFGRAEWIKPYLAERLERLPNENVKNIQVFCPGFSSDCLETIEEIGEESRELFMESSGKEFGFIPCLNGSTKFITLIEDLVINNEKHTIDFRTLF